MHDVNCLTCSGANFTSCCWRETESPIFRQDIVKLLIPTYLHLQSHKRYEILLTNTNTTNTPLCIDRTNHISLFACFLVLASRSTQFINFITIPVPMKASIQQTLLPAALLFSHGALALIPSTPGEQSESFLRASYGSPRVLVLHRWTHCSPILFSHYYIVWSRNIARRAIRSTKETISQIRESNLPPRIYIDYLIPLPPATTGKVRTYITSNSVWANHIWFIS